MEELSLATALNREGQSHDDILDEMESIDRFKTTLRDLCSLIVVIVDNKVYLLHQTVKEFLIQDSLQPGNSRSWKHAFAVTESSTVLAEICVWYLHANLTITSFNGLWDYPAFYWTAHFREACFFPQYTMTMLASRLCVPDSKLYDSWSHMHPGEAFPNNPIPIEIACVFGLEPVARLLLDTGKVGPDFKEFDGRESLSWAAENGHESVIRLLLDTGKVDLNPSRFGNQTPLSHTAGSGHESVLRMLIDWGARV